MFLMSLGKNSERNKTKTGVFQTPQDSLPNVYLFKIVSSQINLSRFKHSLFQSNDVFGEEKFLYGSLVWYNFRERAQYCYENMTNGDIKWEYPEVELSEQQTQDNTVMTDDAMDICTTPPPNEHEDLSAAYYHSKGKKSNALSSFYG